MSLRAMIFTKSQGLQVVDVCEVEEKMRTAFLKETFDDQLKAMLKEASR